MRVQVYEQLMAMQRSRRDVLKGAAGAAALAASSSVLSSTPSFAEDSVVSQILKIPGAGNGSPTDADWQKVGELCLGPTKANVKPGEFAGVNAPWKMSGAHTAMKREIPGVGARRNQVLSQALGMSTEAIAVIEAMTAMPIKVPKRATMVGESEGREGRSGDPGARPVPP